MLGGVRRAHAGRQRGEKERGEDRPARREETQDQAVPPIFPFRLGVRQLLSIVHNRGLTVFCLDESTHPKRAVTRMLEARRSPRRLETFIFR